MLIKTLLVYVTTHTSGWVGMLVESVRQWAVTRHAFSTNYIAMSVVECELTFSLGLKPHSVACGEILSPHLSTGD